MPRPTGGARLSIWEDKDMKFTAWTAIAALMLAAPAAMADEDAELTINGEIEIVTKTAAPAHLSDVMDEVMSGWRFRSDETQAMQADDFDNPSMVFVEAALDEWAKVDGSKGK